MRGKEEEEKGEICPSVLSSYLTLGFQSSAQGSVDVQLEFRFHLALTVGRLASIAAGIVAGGLADAEPVALRRYPPSIRHQSHGRSI